LWQDPAGCSPSTDEGRRGITCCDDECSITIDQRIIPEEDSREVESEIIVLFKGLEKDDPDLKVSTRTILLADSWGPTPKDHILISTLVKNAPQIICEELAIEGVTGFVDSRFYWEAGIPVCNYGPGPKVYSESNVHAADENIVIDDLMKSIKVMALTAADLLG